MSTRRSVATIGDVEVDNLAKKTSGLFTNKGTKQLTSRKAKPVRVRGFRKDTGHGSRALRRSHMKGVIIKSELVTTEEPAEDSLPDESCLLSTGKNIQDYLFVTSLDNISLILVALGFT